MSIEYYPVISTGGTMIRNNGIEAPYEIIVIDGGSTDGSSKWLIKQKDTSA